MRRIFSVLVILCVALSAHLSPAKHMHNGLPTIFKPLSSSKKRQPASDEGLFREIFAMLSEDNFDALGKAGELLREMYLVDQLRFVDWCYKTHGKMSPEWRNRIAALFNDKTELVWKMLTNNNIRFAQLPPRPDKQDWVDYWRALAPQRGAIVADFLGGKYTMTVEPRYDPSKDDGHPNPHWAYPSSDD